MIPSPPVPNEIACDVAVIGGGASGLAAAIAAARAGAAVCVIERDVEAGLPILATGNGRCNLSNARLDPARYRHPEAFRAVAGAAPEAQVAEFFESLGLLMAEEGEGRLYPVTRRAESVRDVLLSGCARAGAALRTCCTPAAARHDAAAGAWRLTLREPTAPLRPKRSADAHAALRAKRRALGAAELGERSLTARRVIVACGGSAAEAAALFGLPHLAEEPVLCPLACTPAACAPAAGTTAAGTTAAGASAACAPAAGTPAAGRLRLEELDGLRVEGALALLRGPAREPVAREAGEVLLRSYGVSGIAAFNLSRRARPGDLLELDLFPALTDDELAALLRRREGLIGPLAGAGPGWFDGLLAPALGTAIGATAAAAGDPLACSAHLCKHLALEVLGPACPEQAQVHRGGVPLAAIDPTTLAALPGTAPALHVCGEALDMDADCGGYNLAWAWLSGMRAGENAARLAQEESPHARTV